jgi:hypothetical protein
MPPPPLLPLTVLLSRINMPSLRIPPPPPVPLPLGPMALEMPRVMVTPEMAAVDPELIVMTRWFALVASRIVLPAPHP